MSDEARVSSRCVSLSRVTITVLFVHTWDSTDQEATRQLSQDSSAKGITVQGGTSPPCGTSEEPRITPR